MNEATGLCAQPGLDWMTNWGLEAAISLEDRPAQGGDHGEHAHDHGVGPDHDHEHGHDHGHGHSHGRIDASIVRSRDGVRTVAWSLAILTVTALAQVAVFVFTHSVALLADLIHNFGDALTAIPLGIAFFLRSRRGERTAGLLVVAVIFVSACVAFYEAVRRLVDPPRIDHLWALVAAGIIGYAGNELAARVRLRGGRRLQSPALIADGNHARIDAFVSLGVVVGALLVATGLRIADPVVGLLITLVILKITWDSWRVVRADHPGEAAESG